MTIPQKSKTITLALLIVSQLVVISALAVNIYNKKSKVLGTVSVNPVDKKSIIFNPESELEYFYESSPNSVEQLKLPWQGTTSIQNTINSDTLNERFDYSLEKRDGVFRVISLGDSFTFGAYVNTPENYTERLEDLLNGKIKCTNIEKFEVINLGMGGYDIQYSLERYKLRGKKYNPDLVIWFLKEDDFLHINEILLPKVNYYSQELEKTGEYQELIREGDYYPNWTKANEDMSKEYKMDDILNYQDQILNEASKSIGAPLLLFTFSTTDNKFKNIFKKQTSLQSSIFFFDGITHIWNYPELVFPDGHPSREGHVLIAEELFAYLIENNLISCN